MPLFPFFAVFMLAAAVPAVGQKDEAGDFLSIDCGLETTYSGYMNHNNGISYVSDGNFVDNGENHMVAAEYQRSTESYLNTLRSFPNGSRNCYALPTVSGSKYLVRMWFYYGNYDKNSSPPQFNLQLGVNEWATVSSDEDPTELYRIGETIFVAWASWAPLCLVNINQGTPFVNAVELRPLPSNIYPDVTPKQSMALSDRVNLGSDLDARRYPDDPYDRYWRSLRNVTGTSLISIQSSQITTDPNFPVPLSILQTALMADNNMTMITYSWNDTTHLEKFIAILHVADLQYQQTRQFDVYVNGVRSGSTYNATYLADKPFRTPDWLKGINGHFEIKLFPTPDSELGPILNAYETYALIAHENPMTFAKDFDAIMSIKFEYGIKKNWTGDPCFPSQWEGVKCRDTSNNITRIISIDLSNSNLQGLISTTFTLLTALEYLNLSGNQLNGPIPDSLCHKANISYESDGCNKTRSPRNNTAILATSVVVPVLVMAVLALACLIWRVKRKPNVLQNAQGNIINYHNNLPKRENRRFTYAELEKFTDNFKQFIGQGGFGHVYYGCLEDSTEVAVKMRSESSSHGLNEFLAEVQSLRKVHHRNLVSLVGYCWEKDHLALVYEYMSRGNLYDHLRGKVGANETLNWATRVRIVLEAAQGLDYLHKGCNLPIIHGDVKTSNILLGQNLSGKIADFGLSKTYHSDTQTHISVSAAGSVGYIDPEYYNTGRLTESSDVYSFGVVLLEVATGEPPIIPGQGHIIQRVKKKIATGNISLVADLRLGGSYDFSSMWKIVNIAMMCTADIAAERPKMAVVVTQLNESLEMVEARVGKGGMENLGSDTVSSMSTFAPSPR